MTPAGGDTATSPTPTREGIFAGCAIATNATMPPVTITSARSKAS